MSNTRPSQLGNKYILLDLIGSGGMSEVYRCKLRGQQGFEKIIVLKKLLPDAAKTKETRDNFIDEAKLAALLQHENIGHIYDFGQIDGSYFIAMEYLFGKDLYSIIQRAKERDYAISLEIALYIVSKLCEGMQYAHTLKDLQQRPLNIIHRDLSPHNIFVTYDGKVKIIDFGIAKAELFDNRTKAGVIKGKISYMSPEQLTEEAIDLRSDIFSIGILLYELISGRRMYAGDTASLIQKCMHVNYEKLESVLPGLPTHIYSIIDKCLQQNKEKRFQSCAQMRNEIDDCLYSLGKRPNSHLLKEFILDVFERDYEAEKAKLISTCRRFDQIYSEKDPQAVTLVDKSIENLKDFEPTLVHNGSIAALDSHSAAEKLTPPLPYILRPLWNAFIDKKTFFGGGALLLIIAFAIHFGLKNKERQPDALLIEALQQSSGISSMSAEKADKINVKTDKPIEEVTTGISRKGEIQAMLDKAEHAIKNGHITDPQQGSALALYQQVLKISPGNPIARSGVNTIAASYADSAEQLLVKSDLILAQQNVEKGLGILPENKRLITLKSLISKEKNRVIEELEWKAQRSLDRNDLTTPVDDCAYKYYRNILALDEKNIPALKGMTKIADKYAVLAEYAYRNVKLDKARDFVEKGLTIVPSHKHLLQIKKDLARSKPVIFFKVIEKNFESIVD